MRDPTPTAPGATASADAIPDLYRRLLDEAVATLTRAAHLTWNRQGADGRPVAERCDWAEFVTLAVAGAAANIGSSEEALAGRSGSWEAACVRDLLCATVGPYDHDLYRHRTEPVVVDIAVDDILTEQGAWRPYLDARDEMVRRHDEARAAAAHSDDDATVVAELNRLGGGVAELDEQLERLRKQDWADYGKALEANVHAVAADLPGLPVPVLVNVHLDASRHTPRPSAERVWTLADELLTHAIASTPMPATDQPPPLERLRPAGGRLAGTAVELPHAAQPTPGAAPRWRGPTEPDGPSALGLAR